MKISRILSALCLFQIVTTTSSMATPTVLIEQGLYQSGSGGEFAGTIFNGEALGFTNGYQFQTFCLEKNEYLLYGSTYYFQVNTAAVAGGIGSTISDPLDSRTAWLYNEFTKGAAGELNSRYDFDNSSGQRTSDAGQLQNALWFLEGELTSLTSGSEAEQYVNLANMNGWTGSMIGDIRVLNLYTNENLTGNVQDVLVKITPAAVPAPGALLLSGLGTLVAGYLRKRRSL